MTTAEASVVVTLDIGGSAAKASGYDAAACRSLGTAAVPYPPRRDGLDAGMFHPDDWWSAARQALGELHAQLGLPAGRYLGITVSAIRIPFVLLDGDGEVVTPGLLNGDRRAAAQTARIAAAFGAEQVYQLTGHWLAPEFGLPKLLWTRQCQPAAWRASRAVLQLHDFFIYRLCGVIASEPSAAGMSQLVDVAHRAWARPLLDSLGLPAGLLPELRAPGSLAGGLLPAVAGATGFAAGTPVHLGGGDTHLSAESAGAGQQPAPVVVAGSTAPALLAAAAASLPEQAGALFPLLVSEHVTAGRRALEVNAGRTGSILQLLSGLDAAAAGPALAGELGRRGLTVVSSADPGPGTRSGTGPDSGPGAWPGGGAGTGPDAGAWLTVLAGNPFFGPEGWAASAPPAVIGLAPWHTGSDVIRACLQATCYAIGAILRCLAQAAAAEPPSVIATGGMSRNAQWAQLLADVTGIEVRVRPLDQIAGRGGAVLVTGLDLPAPWLTGLAGEQVFTPDAGQRQAHAAGQARYQELYRSAQLTATAAGTVTG
jgi:xylulokinase